MVDSSTPNAALPNQVAGAQYDWTFSPGTAAEGGDFSGRIRETVRLERSASVEPGHIDADALLDDVRLERGWSASRIDSEAVELTRDVRVQETDTRAHCTNLYRRWTDAPPGAWTVENASVDTLTRDDAPRDGPQSGRQL
ncbi:hypothetical protein [Halocalculus aciditolerans]|uniref:Uncharacterized protein n=1 Tax=Halocalculus aciditolerans TaxID=1383812 RepID=A0A830FM71_9EURY|nr:hypothetical protein [Halocalculus aciditolerans]GGL66407.1 hypothetical protein GCM10009039_25460 [Halocalculus aciditolerans]